MRVRVLLAALAIMLSGQLHAAAVTQSFTSSWNIAPWDYYGDYAAMWWHYVPYQPWNPELGTLETVVATTEFAGERDSEEAIRIRYAFVTGWNPADYQLYREFWLPSGTSFSYAEQFVYDTPAALAIWSSYDYYPPANYYLESRTLSRPHSISALTTLEFTYTPVPEPASLWLVLGGLLALVSVSFSRPGSAAVRSPAA